VTSNSMPKFARLLIWLVPMLVISTLLVAWQVIVDLRNTPRWLLPSPLDVITAMIESADLLWYHAGITLIEMGLGFSIALMLGVAVAILCHLSKWTRRSVYPLLVLSQSIPVILIAPLLVIWFGFGIAPKVALIVLVCFFPIAVSFLDGLQQSDHEINRLLKAMGANRWQLFRIGCLPGALPALASGSKIAATYAVLGAVIAEWLGASRGLGVFLIRSQNSFRADKALAIVLVIAIIGLAAYILIGLLSRIAMPWYELQRKDFS